MDYVAATTENDTLSLLGALAVWYGEGGKNGEVCFFSLSPLQG